MFWFALSVSIINLVFGGALYLRSPKDVQIEPFFLAMFWNVAQWVIFLKYRHWFKERDASDLGEDGLLSTSPYLKGALVEFVILNNIFIIATLRYLA